MLSESELLSLLSLLIVGGMDTTMNQLGLSMQMFIQHPDQWAIAGRASGARPATRSRS